MQSRHCGRYHSFAQGRLSDQHVISRAVAIASIDAEPGDGVGTAGGGAYRARAVVAATGSFRDGYLPDVPGRSEFRGRVLHSSDYRNPGPFVGQRVVVVGGGNSGVQIAVELARVACVSLAVRRRVWFVSQRVLGRDLHWWLRWTGLDYLRLFRDHGTPFVLDAGQYQEAIGQGRPEKPL